MLGCMTRKYSPWTCLEDAGRRGFYHSSSIGAELSTRMGAGLVFGSGRYPRCASGVVGDKR